MCVVSICVAYKLYSAPFHWAPLLPLFHFSPLSHPIGIEYLWSLPYTKKTSTKNSPIWAKFMDFRSPIGCREWFQVKIYLKKTHPLVFVAHSPLPKRWLIEPLLQHENNTQRSHLSLGSLHLTSVSMLKNNKHSIDNFRKTKYTRLPVSPSRSPDNLHVIPPESEREGREEREKHRLGTAMGMNEWVGRRYYPVPMSHPQTQSCQRAQNQRKKLQKERCLRRVGACTSIGETKPGNKVLQRVGVGQTCTAELKNSPWHAAACVVTEKKLGRMSF